MKIRAADEHRLKRDERRLMNEIISLFFIMWAGKPPKKKWKLDGRILTP